MIYYYGWPITSLHNEHEVHSVIQVQDKSTDSESISMYEVLEYLFKFVRYNNSEYSYFRCEEKMNVYKTRVLNSLEHIAKKKNCYQICQYWSYRHLEHTKNP